MSGALPSHRGASLRGFILSLQVDASFRKTHVIFGFAKFTGPLTFGSVLPNIPGMDGFFSDVAEAVASSQLAG